MPHPLTPVLPASRTPRHVRPIAGPLAVLLLALLVPHAAAAKGPEPVQRIPLEPLGFQNISPRYLLSGASMFSLNYVDDQHLLVTFGVTRLMPRLTDCPPDDEDRVVTAVLLELPSGRELARTEWRLHDIGQYLWDLGHGVFLLRERDVLTTFAPLAQLASGKPFAQHPFLHYHRRIDSIFVSADHSLVSIETSKGQTREQEAAQAAAQAAATNQAPPLNRTTALRRRDPATDPKPSPKPDEQPEEGPIEISFVRLIAPPHPADDGNPGYTAQIAGAFRSKQHLRIPLTGEGFLRSAKLSGDDVNLYFVHFTGKTTDLGDFPTSCSPTPTFISRSEFVSFGCRGGDSALELAGFNLHGDLMWQLNFSDSQAYPSFVSAIAAGRFAFSRTLTTSNIFGEETPSTSQLIAQEIRVLQTYNGKQLLKVNASPIQRAGQNYTLSPDGMSLAIVHDPGASQTAPDTQNPHPHHAATIEIYKLPPLTPDDQRQTDAEAALAPPPTTLPIDFTVREVKQEVAATPTRANALRTDQNAALVPDNTPVSTEAERPHPAAATQVAAQAPAQPSASNEGDPADPPVHHRKPPSLYAADPPANSDPPSSDPAKTAPASPPDTP